MRSGVFLALLLFPFFGFTQVKYKIFKVLLLDVNSKPVPNEKIFFVPKSTPSPGEGFIPRSIATTNEQGFCIVKCYDFDEITFGTLKGPNSDKRKIYKKEVHGMKDEPIIITLYI